MICSACDKYIGVEEQTATGPSGVIHSACFKCGTAHGEAIDLLTLADELGRLKKRVQDLERTSEHHAQNIPFRIGGS